MEALGFWAVFWLCYKVAAAWTVFMVIVSNRRLFDFTVQWPEYALAFIPGLNIIVAVIITISTVAEEIFIREERKRKKGKR